MITSALRGEGNLLIAESVEQAQSLAIRGNLAALLVCGDEAKACALVEWIAARQQAQGQGLVATAPVSSPRLLFCAPIGGSRLLKYFNAGLIYHWLPAPLIPAVLREAVRSACADFTWHVEREHMALALASAPRALAEAHAVAAPRTELELESPLVRAPTISLATGDGAPASSTDERMAWIGERPTMPSLAQPFALRTVHDSDRYENPKFVAEGGVGLVVAYTDNRLERRVAVKRLQAQFADRSDLAALLAREARITGSLQHPSIIPVYDAGRDDNGVPFYVMKLVEAPTLVEILGRLRDGHDGPVEHSLGRLLRLFIQVCYAVDYAHSRGVIHCDLKPGNILVGSFGQVLVVDWGLAFVAEEGTVCRGGTPGYVSPEQMEHGGTIDAGTDVYALGAVLYEVLCYRPPFDDAAYWSPQGIRHPRVLPPSPREVAPERSAPEELVEICLRALAVRSADRFASVGALAAAVESFLEGTKERERRQQRADELVRSADELAANYFELVESRPDRVAGVEALRASVAPWEPPERKRELWDAEDTLAVTDAITVRTLQTVAATYEQALEEVRDHPAARRDLVRLYASELQRAEQRRDERDRTYFEGLVSQHDDGSYARAAVGSSSLTIDCAGTAEEIELARVEEQGRCLVPLGIQALGRDPPREIPLAPGTYLVTLSVPGIPAVRIPIVLKGGRRVRIHVDLRQLAGQPAEEVLVAGGPAMLGGSDDGTPGGGQMREVQVGTFFIQERPVSFREYLEFLSHVMRNLGQTASALVPRHGQGAPFWHWNGQQFEMAEMAQWGDDAEALLDVPVFGIDLRGVEGFAKWKSRQTARSYRLPTEEEWEKAARGTDGRLYPWGNHFDASFCCMRESSAGVPRPWPRDSFAADVSPFGVRDMAGGVADWVTPAAGTSRKGVREIVSRGGAWCDWRTDCLLSAHRPYVVGERSARVGFRLVREGPPTITYELDS